MVENALEVFGKSLFTIMLAELGDKTMIATATLAAVHNPLYIMALSLTGFLVANIVPVIIACSIYEYFVDARWILKLASGILFIFVGVYLWRDRNSKTSIGGLGGTFTALVLSEMGDKTQVATMAVAVTVGNPVLPLIGGVLGYMLANIFGIIVFRLLSKSVPAERVKTISAILLILVGVLTLFSSV